MSWSARIPALPSSGEWIETYLQAFEAVGCDELFLFPCSPDPEQVDLLAEVALK